MRLMGDGSQQSDQLSNWAGSCHFAPVMGAKLRLIDSDGIVSRISWSCDSNVELNREMRTCVLPYPHDVGWLELSWTQQRFCCLFVPYVVRISVVMGILILVWWCLMLHSCVFRFDIPPTTAAATTTTTSSLPPPPHRLPRLQEV